MTFSNGGVAAVKKASRLGRVRQNSHVVKRLSINRYHIADHPLLDAVEILSKLLPSRTPLHTSHSIQHYETYRREPCLLTQQPSIPNRFSASFQSFRVMPSGVSKQCTPSLETVFIFQFSLSKHRLNTEFQFAHGGVESDASCRSNNQSRQDFQSSLEE